MGVFYRYDYTEITKNIHPWLKQIQLCPAKWGTHYTSMIQGNIILKNPLRISLERIQKDFDKFRVF